MVNITQVKVHEFIHNKDIEDRQPILVQITNSVVSKIVKIKSLQATM